MFVWTFVLCYGKHYIMGNLVLCGTLCYVEPCVVQNESVIMNLVLWATLCYIEPWVMVTLCFIGKPI